MTELPAHIREQQDEFVTALEDEFAEMIDWIGTGSAKRSVGLDHLQDADSAYFNDNPLEVEMGGSTESLSLDDVDDLHDSVTAFADQEGVAVQQSGADPNIFAYTFYLHGAFLDVEP